MKLIVLPFIPFVLYLIIRKPAYIFILFFCAASLEGGFVSEMKTITVTRGCFLLLIPSFIMYMVTRARWKKYDTTVLVFIGGFFLFYLSSFFWAPNQASAASKMCKLLINLAPCIIGYYLFKNAPNSHYRHFIGLYVLAVAVLLVYMYLQMDEIILLGELSTRTAQRVAPFNANAFGRGLVIGLSMLTGLIFCTRRLFIVLALSFVFLAACLPLLIIAGSRSSIVIFALTCLMMVIVYCYVHELRSGLKFFAVLGILVIVGVVTFVYAREILPENLSYRVSRLLGEPLSVVRENRRIVLFKQSLTLVESSPFWGVGLRGYEATMQYPHNVVLEILVETGFLGLTFFLFAISVLVRRCFDLLRYSAKRMPEWFSIVFVVVFSVVSSGMFALFVGEVSDHRIWFFLLSILMALDHRVRTIGVT